MWNIRSLRTFAILAATALLTFTDMNARAAEVSYKYATVDSIKIFYREAGDPGKRTILLLHGFPSSSHQFRDLIPLLSDNFHVVAPDYPGMGYSDAPPAKKFTPTFDNLTKLMTDFVEKLGDRHLIVYITDFGGPVGMRMAVSHPDWISGLVFQNANISLDGVDPARLKRNEENAAGITPARRAEAAAHVSMATALRLYKEGTRNPAALNPDAWTNDERVWRFEPDAERVRVIPLTPDTAEIYAPTQVTSGTSNETAKTAPFLVYEVAVRTPEGWRIAAIVPVPAQ